jgi:plasmid stabilization system protein ParE
LTFIVQFNPEASQDVEAAFAWYERLRSGLGDAFVRSVAAGSENLSRNPERHPVTREPFRWLKLRRFPYGLHYYIEGKKVIILACLHFRQSAERWPNKD